MNKKLIGKTADFFIKMVIIFASLLSLLQAGYFISGQAATLAIISLLFLIAVIVKGIIYLISDK